MPRTRNSWDLLVIGAGPAGCAAAIHAASQGLSVALLERQCFPRERPGETLHPGIEPLMERLGAAEAMRRAGFLRHPGHWVQWGTEPPRFEAFGADSSGPWCGFQARRAALDALLLNEARQHGVCVFQPCRALRPVVEEGHVCGALTGSGLMRSAFLVDASGGKHWLARHLGQPLQTASPRRIVRYGYLRGEWPEAERGPLLRGDCNGWLWIARIQAGLYAWNRLSFAGDRTDLPPGLEHNLQPEGKPVRSEDVTWRVAEACAGPGFFLTGDAASVLDPASSHVVLKALMTGMMAAHTIGQALQGDCKREREAAAGYTQWLKRWFQHDCFRLEELYAALN